MTAVVPMFELPGSWNVPVFAIYPVPLVHMVGVAAFHNWQGEEDEGSRMRKAMTEMPVHFSLCERPQKKILCYGDSLTAGFFAGGLKFDPYGRTMAEVLASGGIHAQVSVCGHSGCTTREMLDAAETDLSDVVGCTGNGLCRILEDQRFDLVIIMSGTNDMGKGTPSDVIVEDLCQLHAICHLQGVPTLALAPPAAPRNDLAQEMQRQYICNQLLASAAMTPYLLGCIDPADLVPVVEAQYWETDGLHFAPRGSQVLGQSLALVVAQLAHP